MSLRHGVSGRLNPERTHAATSRELKLVPPSSACLKYMDSPSFTAFAAWRVDISYIGGVGLFVLLSL